MLHFLSSPWIPLLALAGTAVTTRILHGSWLHPAVFPSFVWTNFVFFALVVAPEYQVGGLGVWVIVGLNTATYLGACFASNRCVRPEPSERSIVFSVRRWVRWVVIFSLLALTGAVLLAGISLADNGLPTSLAGLLVLGHALSVARYSGVQEPAIVRALWMWVFPAAVLGGVTFVFARNRFEKWLSLSPFLSAFAYSLVETTRGSFIITICCWLGAFLGAKVYITNGEYRIFSRRNLVAVSLILVTVSFAFVLFDAFRVLTPDHELEVEPNAARTKAYFVGSLSFFDHWVDDDPSLKNVTFGTETFRSFSELIGLRSWEINPALILRGGGETNIPTAFQGLIQDFTFPGALLICVVWGYASGVAFEAAQRGQKTGITLLAAYYSLYIFSPVIALTAYNGPILGWITLAFLLRPTKQVVGTCNSIISA